MMERKGLIIVCCNIEGNAEAGGRPHLCLFAWVQPHPTCVVHYLCTFDQAPSDIMSASYALATWAFKQFHDLECKIWVVYGIIKYNRDSCYEKKLSWQWTIWLFANIWSFRTFLCSSMHSDMLDVTGTTDMHQFTSTFINLQRRKYCGKHFEGIQHVGPKTMCEEWWVLNTVYGYDSWYCLQEYKTMGWDTEIQCTSSTINFYAIVFENSNSRALNIKSGKRGARSTPAQPLSQKSLNPDRQMHPRTWPEQLPVQYHMIHFQTHQNL